MAVLICYDGKMAKRPTSKRPENRERIYTVRLSCGHFTSLRMCDAKRAYNRESRCVSCAASKNGRLGYRASIGKMDKRKLLEKIAERQTHNPVQAELRIARWLQELGISYKRQVIFISREINAVIDFVVGNDFLEVNGFWHRTTRSQRDSLLANAYCDGRVIFIDDNITFDELSELSRNMGWA